MDKKKQLTIDDMTFNEIADYATIRIHLALLENGGKGMSAEVHKWMSQIISWDKRKDVA